MAALPARSRMMEVVAVPSACGTAAFSSSAVAAFQNAVLPSWLPAMSTTVTSPDTRLVSVSSSGADVHGTAPRKVSTAPVRAVLVASPNAT